MDNITKLKNEIAQDPLARGYSGMSNAAVLASLRAKNIDKYVQITSAELLAWAGANERKRKLQAAANDVSKSEAIRNIAEIALLLLQRDNAGLDLNLGDRNNMLNALIAAGVLSAQDRNDLIALANKPVSRAEQLGIENVNFTESDIALARS